jgi:hypothetical protein
MKISELPDDELVRVFITLREQRAKMKAAYTNADEETKAKQAKVQGLLLTRFNAAGVEAVRTKHGTAYKQSKTFANVSDKESFMTFVKENDAYELIEARCSKIAIDQYKAAHDDIPPGINYHEEIVVNIRRS